MTGNFEARTIGGWLRPLVAAAIVFAIGLYLGFGMTIFGGFPRAAVEPAAAFAIVFTTGFTAGRLAPHARFRAALVASGLACAIGQAVALSLVGSVAGALVALGVSAAGSTDGELSSHVRRILRVVGLGAFIGLAGFVYSRHVDWPAVSDPLPRPLLDFVGPDPDRLAAFYETDLGGFIDREALWRIEADESVLDELVVWLAAAPVAEAPTAFFRMPPHDWIRAMPPAGQAYASPGFRSASRGADGEHYFIVRDRDGHAFVWVKSNF